MTQVINVSATMTGKHDITSDDISAMCDAIERDLANSTAKFTVRSFIQDHEFSADGEKSGPDKISIKITQSSFRVTWETPDKFSLLPILLDIMNNHLKILGDITVNISAMLNNVKITMPSIGSSPPIQKLRIMLFELPVPDTASDSAQHDVKFTAIAVPSATNALFIIAQYTIDTQGLKSINDNLRVLSDHCEVYCR